MHSINSIIPKVIDHIFNKKADHQLKIQETWRKLWDAQERGHAAIVGIKNGCLVVSVDSAAWLYQMNLKKEKILKRLQAEVPEIESITFRIGKTR